MMISLCVNAGAPLTKKAPVNFMQRNVSATLGDNFMAHTNKFEQAAKRRNVKRKANLAQNERIIGLYTSDEYSDDGLGLSQYPGNYEVMIFMSVDEYRKMVGEKMTSVRFALADACDINRVFVYEFPESEEEPATTIAEVNTTGRTFTAGWNQVELTNPCTLPDNCEGIAIGFEYVQRMNAYPLSAIQKYADNGFILYGDLGDGEGFYNFAENGILSIQGIVECNNLPGIDIVLNGFDIYNYTVSAGSTISYGFGIYNYGQQTIDTYEVDIMLDGKVVDTLTEEDYVMTNDNTMLAAQLTLPADLARGKHTLSMEVVKVNGEAPKENTYDDKVEIGFTSYLQGDAVARQKFLVEEMTSHTCQYCTLGAYVLEMMQEMNDKLAIACIHGNQSSKDPYNTAECQSLLAYLGCTSFPSASFNRIYFGAEEGIAPGIGYDQQYATQVATQLLDIMEENSLPAFATVNINSEFNADSTAISVTVNGKGGAAAKQLLEDFSLTVYVTEDSLKYRQKNTNGAWISNYYHEHVMRKVATEINGDDINWTSDSEYSNTFDIALDSKWKVKDLALVAFISKKQPLEYVNWADMEVSNANSIYLIKKQTSGGGTDDPDDDTKVDAGVIITPINNACQFMAEGMSANGKFVAGQNYSGAMPAIWNTTTGQVKNFAEYEEGTLHGVSNNGVGVGTTKGYGGKALMCNVDGTTTILKDNGGENTQGADAWAVTSDGKTAAGFYYYFKWLDEEQTDGFYAVYPCVWADGKCTNISYPSKETLGYNVDGAGARWMSEDGNVILGYVIDDLARWPAVVWEKGSNGEYVCNPICKDFFEMEYLQGKPYMLFTPRGLSANGEWISLQVQEEYDDFDFSNPAPALKAARYNLKTKTLEVLDMEGVAMDASGIANDGGMLAFTAIDGIFGRQGYYWPADSKTATCLDTDLAHVKDMPEMGANIPVSFANDNKTIMGFGIDTDTDIFSYVINLNYIKTSINNITADRVISVDDRLYNIAGQRMADMKKPGLYILNGKKYMVK